MGDEPYDVCRAEKLSVQVYLGHLGRRTRSVEEINGAGERWLIIPDRGLTELGACRPDPAGGYVAELPGAKRGRRKCRLRTLPEELGDVLAA
ncbi:MAG: hypothetical protein J7M21_00150, partial [Planctomycetes bacterium]|nr:hypothetical protein [Planctomycetota bacterium]